MTIYLYYDPETGDALYTVTGVIKPDGAHIEVPADFDITGVQVIDGVPVRSEPDPEQVLSERRAAASLTKPEFIIACMSVGILTPEEATQAAHGIIPDPFQQAVDSLPPYEKTILNIIWPTATQIDRMDPLILALADGLGVADHMLDALFGLVEYQP